MHRREHTVKQDLHFITTRLFRVGHTGSSTAVEISKESNLRPIDEPKVFSSNGIEFLGLPPNQSIHSIGTLSQKKNQAPDYTYNLENWITVFCINPQEKDDIVRYFNNLGEISNVVPPSNNYMSLEFVNKSDVDEIMEKCKNQPIIVNSGNAVFCERGKFSLPNKSPEIEYELPHYHTLKERIQSEVTFWEVIQEFFHFIKWNFY